MSLKKFRPEEGIIAEARRNRALREKEYREQALKMYPHLCARCGREFSGKKLRELTVHHKDHNHDNNPPDGSNWETASRPAGPQAMRKEHQPTSLLPVSMPC
jgi:hypothetical protein